MAAPLFYSLLFQQVRVRSVGFLYGPYSTGVGALKRCIALWGSLERLSEYISSGKTLSDKSFKGRRSLAVRFLRIPGFGV